MPVPDFESLDDGCAESVWPGSAHATFWPVAAAIPTPTATTARPKRRGARLPCALRRAGTAINPLWHSVVVSRTSRRRGPADRRTRCRQHMTTCDINLRFVGEPSFESLSGPLLSSSRSTLLGLIAAKVLVIPTRVSDRLHRVALIRSLGAGTAKRHRNRTSPACSSAASTRSITSSGSPHVRRNSS